MSSSTSMQLNGWLRAVMCGSDAVFDVALPAISSHPCHTLMLFQYLLFIFTSLVGSSLYCNVNCACKKNNVKFHQNDSTLGNQCTLGSCILLLFLLYLFLVFDGLVRGWMRWPILSYLLRCSHKGSKYPIFRIKIRRWSLPSISTLGNGASYHTRTGAIDVSIGSLLDSSTCGPRASLLAARWPTT